MNTEKVGSQIMELRKARGMTQGALGERLGVTFQAVSKWERGETLPDTAILVDLADALGTTVDFILTGQEPAIGGKRPVTVEQMAEGVRCIGTMRELLGPDNLLYRLAVKGINEGMNTDIEPAFSDEHIFEVFVAEAVIQSLRAGATVELRDVKLNFKDEKLRNTVLDYCKKYDSEE